MEQGFNHNIEHRGLVFHVQTEDSGVAHCALRTHLFHDGQILTSTKSSYRENSPPEDIQAAMKAQHKAMVGMLISGEYDTLIQDGGIHLETVTWPIQVPDWLSSRPLPLFLKPSTRTAEMESEPDTQQMQSTILECAASTESKESAPDSSANDPLVDVLVTALDDT